MAGTARRLWRSGGRDADTSRYQRRTKDERGPGAGSNGVPDDGDHATLSSPAGTRPHDTQDLPPGISLPAMAGTPSGARARSLPHHEHIPAATAPESVREIQNASPQRVDQDFAVEVESIRIRSSTARATSIDELTTGDEDGKQQRKYSSSVPCYACVYEVTNLRLVSGTVSSSCVRHRASRVAKGTTASKVPRASLQTGVILRGGGR
ncbi:hypothetical protein C8R44DRAFT_880518 [Mycena epipterygia]|nr:hypothetical protein C8R44DRAFT_880518 [Mycena epipterygia]